MFNNVHINQSYLFTVGQFSSDSSETSTPSPQSTLSESKHFVSNVIHNQPFTQKFELFFPVQDSGIGYKLAPTLEPIYTSFYALEQSPMVFCDEQVKKRLFSLGRPYALSIGRRIDVDDAFAIYPSGELLLSLTKDTFMSTGFSTDNKHSRHRNATFETKALDLAPSLVSIDLTSEKEHAQANFVLRSNIIGPSTFFLAWEPHAATKGSVTAVTAQNEASDPKLGFPVTRLLLNSERKTLRNLQVPIIDIASLTTKRPLLQKSQEKTPSRSILHQIECGDRSLESTPSLQEETIPNEEYIEEIMEWIGALHNRVRNYVEGAPIHPAISLIAPGAIPKRTMFGLSFVHTGLLTPLWVLDQLDKARKVVDAELAPYAILTAWAFADDPLHSIDNLHDSHYTILVLPKNHYVVIRPLRR